MSKIKIKIALAISALFSVLAFAPAFVAADCSNPQTTQEQIQCGATDAAGGKSTSSSNLDSTVKTVINLLSIIVGIVAVIMIIIAGFKYITSAGDSNKVTSAKNTLLYALIGLVIVALAQTIAHFALNEANNPSSSSFHNTTAVYQKWS